jgi:hypothetical protein
MIPSDLHSIFWGTNLDTFAPEAYPDYTNLRVLEPGDEAAVAWLRQTLSEADIRRVPKIEHRLSEKSATFWALVYGVPSRDVAALNASR